MLKRLTEPQERFLAAYRANGGDGPAAVIETYHRKYGPEAAAKKAETLLLHPRIAARLAKPAVAAQLPVPTADADLAARVIEELKTIGFANLADYVTWSNGEVVFKDSATLTPAQTAALVEITKSGDGVRLKFDKLTALNLLGRYFGIFRESPHRNRMPGGDGEPGAATREISVAERRRRLVYLLEGCSVPTEKKNNQETKKSVDDPV